MLFSGMCQLDYAKNVIRQHEGPPSFCHYNSSTLPSHMRLFLEALYDFIHVIDVIQDMQT